MYQTYALQMSCHYRVLLIFGWSCFFLILLSREFPCVKISNFIINQILGIKSLFMIPLRISTIDIEGSLLIMSLINSAI